MAKKDGLVEKDGEKYIVQKYRKEKPVERAALATFDIIVLGFGIMVAIIAVMCILAYCTGQL